VESPQALATVFCEPGAEGEFKESLQHPDLIGVVMAGRGRPRIARQVEREFWRQIATGLSTRDAAAAVGVSRRERAVLSGASGACRAQGNGRSLLVALLMRGHAR
jgi:hypothetical protein